MTFEEFLKKKKIDPVQFERAEPALFSEFVKHFDQMGEKSFDHSKKFWFNKLRRAHHLKEEPKPSTPVDANANPIADQAEPLLSPSVEATVHTPRIESQAAATSESTSVTTGNKPGFTPRFRAGATKTAPAEAPAADPASPDTSESASTPAGFKPRFKAGLTKPASTEQGSETPATEEKTSSPQGFKPRFKAGLTGKPKAPAADQPETSPETPTETPDIAKKKGFTPRFKAGLTNTKKETGNTAGEEKPTQSEGSPAPVADENPAKPAYKPRFKPSMVKPKNEEE